jgi:hypothetical protein
VLGHRLGRLSEPGAEHRLAVGSSRHVIWAGGAKRTFNSHRPAAPLTMPIMIKKYITSDA